MSVKIDEVRERFGIGTRISWCVLVRMLVGAERCLPPERNRLMTHLSNKFPRNRLFALSDFYYSRYGAVATARSRSLARSLARLLARSPVSININWSCLCNITLHTPAHFFPRNINIRAWRRWWWWSKRGVGLSTARETSILTRCARSLAHSSIPSF